MSSGDGDQDLLTNEVTALLEKEAEHLGIKNYHIDVSPGSLRGDNYLGIIANVIVTGEGKNGQKKTLDWIVKSAPRNSTFRSYIPVRTAYIREIYMYSHVFPEFAKLQKEKSVLHPFKSYAKYYMSTMNNLNEAIIMKNMKPLGYKLGNRLEPLDYDHVLLVLKEYGKYHALSFALRDQKPQVFQELVDNTHDIFFAEFKGVQDDEIRHRNYNRALESLDPVEDAIAYNSFKNAFPSFRDGVERVLSCEEAGKYAVIGHGDSWTNNILFKYNEKDNSPTNVCILDWQLARAGSPALDLAYFIFVCTDSKLREKHYDNLIREYYDSLSSHLRELGSDPEALFPFVVLQEHLRKFSLYGLFMALSILHIITSEMEHIPDVNALEDSEDAKDKFNFQSTNKYKSMMRGVILDYLKYGYAL